MNTKASQQCSLLEQHVNPSLPCDCRHNKPISQSCDFYKILIQMSVKVTLWLFKAVLYSHLAALYQTPFPVWLSAPVNIQTGQTASTLPCSPVETTHGKLCQTEAGLGLCWARQALVQGIPAELVAGSTRQCVFGVGRVLESPSLPPCPKENISR